MKKERDITFHYTNEQMVKDLIAITPLSGSVLDAGSGKNKVWYNNIPYDLEKYECEIENGCDFFKWNKKVDWVVGNPPYHNSWNFTEKAVEIANKGVAWLVNNQALNSHLRPARLDWLKDSGFQYTKIHVVADKRWFGRYYYIILQRSDNGILSWKRETY